MIIIIKLKLNRGLNSLVENFKKLNDQDIDEYQKNVHKLTVEITNALNGKNSEVIVESLVYILSLTISSLHKDYKERLKETEIIADHLVDKVKMYMNPEGDKIMHKLCMADYG